MRIRIKKWGKRRGREGTYEWIEEKDSQGKEE